MTDLSGLRQEIDEIDQRLVELLDRRAEIAREVGRTKAGTGKATFDAGRHRAVLERALERSSGAFPREGLRTVFREVLSVCLNLQKPLKVAYLGPAATFSHQAAIREFGTAVEFVPYDRIRDIIHAIHKGWADYGVVPVENSTGGVVGDTLDAFIDYEVLICHEVMLPIQHSLVGRCAIEEVRTIYSHPQTFRQCGIWLREHLPKAEQIEVASTATGMQKAQSTEGAAAIGSHLAADIYGLRILAKGIEDNSDNSTRFLIVSHSDSAPTGRDKTSIMISIKDRAGVLLNLVQPFAQRGLNLSKIESRPTKKKAWEYVFFLDVEGHRSDPTVQEALKEIEPYTYWLRVLGSYPRHLDSTEQKNTADQIESGE